jgi:hypothetical protein
MEINNADETAQKDTQGKFKRSKYHCGNKNNGKYNPIG